MDRKRVISFKNYFKSTLVIIIYSYTILKMRLYVLLVLWLVFLQWNIHIKEQYENCTRINTFIMLRFLLMSMQLAILARAWNFCSAFIQRFSTWGSKVSLLSITIPQNFSSKEVLIISFSILTRTSSEVLVNKWRLSAFATI